MSDGMMEAYRDGLEQDAYAAYKVAMVEYVAKPSKERRSRVLEAYTAYNRDEAWIAAVGRRLDRIDAGDRPQIMSACCGAMDDIRHDDIPRVKKALDAIQRKHGFDPRRVVEIRGGRLHRVGSALSDIIKSADRSTKETRGHDEHVVIEIPPEAAALITATVIKRARTAP